jgi:hypothetical protein
VPFYEPVCVMKFCFFLSSLNPLSLMKSTRFFRNFVFLFSLLGLGSFAWGERYHTINVKTDDTNKMTHEAAKSYLKSDACISTESLQLQQGEIAYVFSSGASSRPSGTSELPSFSVKDAFVSKILIDYAGMESNSSKGNWDPHTTNWSALTNNITNIVTNEPIVGPAEIRIFIKPWSGREGSYSNWDGFWEYYSPSNPTYINNWDFKASEGFVTFRIVGAEQAPSKKFATVIPENASGNVRIVLEQSTDLINWSSANPGVFSPSTSKRFFRVRSVEE